MWFTREETESWAAAAGPQFTQFWSGGAEICHLCYWVPELWSITHVPPASTPTFWFDALQRGALGGSISKHKGRLSLFLFLFLTTFIVLQQGVGVM